MSKSFEWRVEADVSIIILDAMLTHSVMVQNICTFSQFSLGFIAFFL